MLIAKNFLTTWPLYKPSYFTSCSQLGRSGTLAALVGRQNSKRAGHWLAEREGRKPSLRRSGREFRILGSDPGVDDKPELLLALTAPLAIPQPRGGAFLGAPSSSARARFGSK